MKFHVSRPVKFIVTHTWNDGWANQNALEMGNLFVLNTGLQVISQPVACGGDRKRIEMFGFSLDGQQVKK